MPVELNLKAKGDRFLYYKRRFERVENTMKVFPFWNNIYIWIFLSYSLVTLYFILFLIEKSFSGFPDKTALFLFQSNSELLKKQYLYMLFFIPFVNILITSAIGYRIYNTKKYLAYTLIIINVICTALFLTAIIKIIQMNYAIIG